jgi:GTPase SAR1 family protein
MNVFVTLQNDSIFEFVEFKGGQKYRKIRDLFYCYYDAYIFVYDMTNHNSYRNIESWIEEVNPWLTDTYNFLPKGIA